MKKKKERRAGKRITLALLLVIIIAGVIFGIYAVTSNETGMKSIFGKVQNINANLTEFIVYGTHLNIKGEINEVTPELESVNLVFSKLDGNEEKIKLKFEENAGNIVFSTSDILNDGIDLEKIELSKHYMLIELEYGKNERKYYSIENKTEYDDLIYYTITKNDANNRIDIKFDKYESEEKTTDYMFIEAKHTKLPKDVYDVVVDAGHGGADNGAEYNGYHEADLTLEYANMIKKELEKLGLKVGITRDGTENKETFGVYSVYDEDGRVNVVGKSKAKYVFSIHLNSIEIPNSQSGVEIYAPTKIDLGFAKSFADNIVRYANTTYSDLDANYEMAQGVYVRTFKDWEIEDSENDARAGGYEPYTITADTPYLYMLRETGGIATGAYVDGRNKNYGKNLYVNSNIGVEAYLIELGYLNNKKNLNNLLTNKEGYVKGVVEAVKEQVFGRSEWLKLAYIYKIWYN